MARTRGTETESDHGRALMDWWWRQFPQYPLDLYHVPNERSNKVQAQRLKAEGVVAGVSDYCLAQARGGYFGLYLELKKPGGRATDTQRAFVQRRIDTGYFSVFAYCWTDAKDIILLYMAWEKTKITNLKRVTSC